MHIKEIYFTVIKSIEIQKHFSSMPIPYVLFLFKKLSHPLTTEKKKIIISVLFVNYEVKLVCLFKYLPSYWSSILDNLIGSHIENMKNNVFVVGTLLMRNIQNESALY